MATGTILHELHGDLTEACSCMNPTRLVESSWNTTPGNEALVGKPQHDHVRVSEHRMEWSYEFRSSIQPLNLALVWQ